MNNIILKVNDGELFNFFDSESRKSFTIGSKRSCDLVVKSSLVAPEQFKFICKDDVWYVEDLTPEGFKSEALIGGKRFRRPIVKFDNELTIRKTGEKKSKDVIRISVVKKISRRRSGSKVDLSQKTITLVGRNPACDIVVDNPMVSEKHFHIIYDEKTCFIEDLHSINGTYVNNRKIRRAELKDYDRISIPSAAYTFYDKKLLFSTSAAGIQIDSVGVCKEVYDRKSRGKISLVNNVSFRIKAGDFVAIVGGSGTGKSTLLDCINGIRPATDGGIYYDTNSYYDNIKSYKEVIGYVPQKDIMHDDLTVEEGLYYTARLRMRSSMFKDEVRERVKQAIADVRLTGREKVRISSLSGGQRKRVSIAMELLSDPKVIFLDEPTSGLSPDLDLEMMGLLKELAKQGRTIVVITHAMENLDKCDKIAFLGRNGRLCFYGDHKDIFRYFNRKSYSRIFAALGDEKICAYFENKYRAGEYYKKLYAAFRELYGECSTLLPPIARKKTKPTEENGASGKPSRKRTAKARTDEETARSVEDKSAAAPVNAAHEDAADAEYGKHAFADFSENTEDNYDAYPSEEEVFDVIPDFERDEEPLYFTDDLSADVDASPSADAVSAEATEEPAAPNEGSAPNVADNRRAKKSSARTRKTPTGGKTGGEPLENADARKEPSVDAKETERAETADTEESGASLHGTVAADGTQTAAAEKKSGGKHAKNGVKTAPDTKETKKSNSEPAHEDNASAVENGGAPIQPEADTGSERKPKRDRPRKTPSESTDREDNE